MLEQELFNDLCRAYFCARKNKANSKSHLRFYANLHENLMNLSHVIADHSYAILPSICFINEKPVKREIVAADFRDRVVHHFLFNLINPCFERKFIYDSYSCRKGKGTLFGIRRMEHFMRVASENYQKEAYVLKLDISGFFMNINRDKLYKICMDTMNDVWLDKNNADRKIMLYRDIIVDLVKKVIYNNPLENAVYRSSPSSWTNLPKNKSLKNSPANCGLPIGNLTSQLFANVYLNELDQFVKRKLKMKCYGRYVDDFVLMHQSKDVLLQAKTEIEKYLKEFLGLTLHPNKVYLQPYTKGFAFIGAYLLPYRKYISRRIQGNFLHAMFNDFDSKFYDEKVVSYLGLMKHFDCCRFLRRYYIERNLV